MSLDQRPYDEKRGFMRVPVDCEVTLERVTDGRRFMGRGKNLSASGVLFHTDEPLRPGERLDIHIEANQALRSVLDGTIEVVRVEAIGDGLSYAVGSAIKTIRQQ